MHPHVAVFVQAFGAASIDSAIGHNGVLAGQADLPAVRVPVQGELVAVRKESVQHSRLWGVGQADGKVGVGVRRPGDQGIIVQIVVRVVHPGDGQPHPAGFEFDALVGGVVPSVFDKGGAHSLPGQCLFADFAFFAHEVAEGVNGFRPEVVVGSEHKYPWPPEQRVQGAQYVGDCGGVAKVIAGVYYEVRLQEGQRVYPRDFVFLPGHHVQVGDVQDPEFGFSVEGPGLQKWYFHAVEFEIGGFLVCPQGGDSAERGEAAKNA